MVTRLLWILLGSMLLAACALTTNDSASQPTTVSLLPTETITSPTPTDTITPTDTPAPSTPTEIPCTPRSDWVQYTVQRGDTLATIAARVGSTIDALVSANCLANPDQILQK